MKKSEQKLNEILSYLKEYTKDNSFAPSYREIASAVGLKSTNSVKEYLDILENNGEITRQSEKSRTIEVVKNRLNDVIDLPVVGQVAAGVPILAEQNIDDFISISSSFLNIKDTSKLFVLRVKGDSMVDIGINSGDFVIAYSQNVAENGDVVVAMIDNSATVKTFYKTQNNITLQPANPLYKPIVSNEVVVLGKVVGVMRRM